VNDGVARRASSIQWQAKRQGKSISRFDCLMAACYLEAGVQKILTRNAQDFAAIKGLEVVRY
jgi:predicted nucleic acid-binding protein